MLKDDINVPLLVTIGTVSSVLLVVILIGVHAWFLWEFKYETDKKWAGTTNERVTTLKKSQADSLKVIAKADPAKGTYRIPIEKAMEAVAASGGKLPK
jgi:hypothetical protein